MAGSPISDLLADGSIGRQLLVWGVLNSLITTAGQPVLQEVLNNVYPKVQAGRLTADEAAEMVLKGILSEDAGASEATATGFSHERFTHKVRNQGEPISPRDALEALRRGVIGQDAGPGGGPSFYEAVRQSRLRNEWAPVLEALQWVPLPVSDAVDAVVEGQIEYADGEAQAKINGVKPEEFRILVNTRGRPPSPTELAELLRRKFIPLEGTGPDATTFQQGIYEGATKNKWWRLFARLADYLPPPRTITALLHEGAITKAQAAELFQESGLSAELAQAYVASAAHAKLAKQRDLALTTVLELFEAHALTDAEATEAIEHLGYDEHETAYLLRLHDLQRSLKAVNAAIQRVGSLYITRKLSEHDTVDALDSLGLSKAHADELMAVWTLERRKTVKVLTPAQIAAAVYYDVIKFDEGVRKLVADGYTEEDARIVIDVRLHGVPTAPAA